MRVEYQLIDFEILRHTLSDKVCAEGLEFNRSNFSKGVLYHLYYLAGVLGFSVLGLYVGANGNPVLGYGAMSLLVIFIVYEYAVTATGIKVTNDSLEIAYPAGKRNISFSDITDIQITDEFHKGNRIPEVWVISNPRKILDNLTQFQYNLHKAPQGWLSSTTFIRRCAMVQVNLGEPGGSLRQFTQNRYVYTQKKYERRKR